MNSEKAEKALPPSWVIVVASMICLSVGSTPVTVFSAGLLLGPMTTEFGWTHAEFWMPRLLGTIVGAITAPLLGALADRVGVRKLLLPGIILYAAVNAGLSFIDGSLAVYFGLSLLVGVVCYFQSPPLYLKAVSLRTDRHRGIATSIALAGTGIGAAVLMPIIALLISTYGWRSVPVGLSIIMVAVALPTVFFLVRDPDTLRSATSQDTEVHDGLTPAQAFRTKNFWLMVGMFLIGGVAINGIFSNMASLLNERGMGAAVAASVLSGVALAQMAGRLGAGALLDRIRTPKVGVLWFAFAMAGVAIVGQAQTAETAALGAILLGLGLGAELELAAYYTSRYFGLANFGRLYSMLFSAFVVGTGLGPVIVGHLFDVTGGFGLATTAAVGLLGLNCLLVLLLGPYVFVPEEKGKEPVNSPQIPTR